MKPFAAEDCEEIVMMIGDRRELLLKECLVHHIIRGAAPGATRALYSN
jgi:hypothetical protein